MDKLVDLDQLENEFKKCRNALAAIGDETRQLIILCLMKGTFPGMRVGEITENVKLSRPAVSHHLKVLKDAKIVSVVKQGTMNFYHINPTTSDLNLLKKLFSQIEISMFECFKSE
jgi:DNA-binding transcriptional ArsR family regulator